MHVDARQRGQRPASSYRVSHQRPASITTADVRTYIAKRKGDVIETGSGKQKKSRPVSNAEINRELTALKRMFSLAVQAG